ncbi:MAG: 50S ribosomal protein L23 [Candidatus Manganitrophaceae bacterium]|nr:MAG: 50S ribosomal protein L23 [Candidatus Manganitrophaceae bacterium]
MNRHDIILRPVLTEKSTQLREAQNKYSFMVQPKANKNEVKRAVEETLNVKVENVRIVNVLGKEKRLGRFSGKRPDWKKAIVTLKEGEKLTLFEG